MMLATLVAGGLLTWVGPRTMMLVSGLLSASPGLIWLLAMGCKRFSVPTGAVRESYSQSAAAACS